MFDKSYFDTLQDYIASGCTMELTADELDYYNALYALVGINRKYGKDNAIAFLMHEPFNVERLRARKMYSEAINLFYLNDTIENNAHRNMMFDNLMNNICKYAQRGTRVYLTLEERDGQAVISFKNTSRAPVDIPAEELLERFVRGDAARGGEGNGLGLSIASSFTEACGGDFHVETLADLFTAVVSFPLAEES